MIDPWNKSLFIQPGCRYSQMGGKVTSIHTNYTFNYLSLPILQMGSSIDYTEKNLIEFALDAKEEGELQQVSLVLNHVKPDNLGYGNKYGYGYEEENVVNSNKEKKSTSRSES